MASTKDEITAIAVEHGYAGAKPASIAGAIDALADTLAGEDVMGSRSISGAVKAIAPYIGSGGGGGAKTGKLVCIAAASELGGMPPYGWMFSTNTKPAVGNFPMPRESNSPLYPLALTPLCLLRSGLRIVQRGQSQA